MTELQEEITPVQIEVARIERDFGIYTPSFISELPPINPQEAASFALDSGFIPDYIFTRYKDDQETIDYFAAKDGLDYCRKRRQTVLQAQLEGPPQTEWSKSELYNRFSNRKIDREEVKRSEEVRREKRDLEIFKMEQSIVKSKLPNQIPESIKDLDSYCEWIAKKSSKNDITTGATVYWDLQEHYQEVARAAWRSFDPLSEWKAYLNGNFDLTDSDNWNLKNIGPDLSYYALGERFRIPRRTPKKEGYDSTLITHSATDLYIPTIMWTNSILPGHYGVCYSEGQVLMGGYEVAFIFDREDIQNTYSAFPYVESMGLHEREIRSTEVNSMDLCLGCVPITPDIFPDIYQESLHYPQQPAGRVVLSQWGENYKQTGSLWTPADREKIEEVIEKLDKKST